MDLLLSALDLFMLLLALFFCAEVFIRHVGSVGLATSSTAREEAHLTQLDPGVRCCSTFQHA